VELCSFSKTAGFTGTRCGYTVIPKELKLTDGKGGKHSFFNVWCRREGSKFNGVSYPVQRAAEAVFTKAAEPQIEETLNYYRENAKTICRVLDELGISYTGGKNSPYVWFKCPGNMNSWEFFDKMLRDIQVVGTPGAGFGKNGNNWFRLTSFGTHENTLAATERLKTLLK
jgi:LL-diaminopimelate aminotransferase